MKLSLSTALAIALISISFCPLARADFKYSEQSKMTGGSLMKMTQTLGVFSKSMRQANQATTTTTMVKGNRMRQESSDGKVQIIDLDGRRFIYVDPATRQYSIVTFDDFKAAMQRAEQQAQAQQAQQQAQAQANPQAQQNPNVKITPKFDAEATGASRNILGLPVNEMKMKMEMVMESTDPQTQGQSGSFLVTSDAWMASSVPGYDEVRTFQMKLAKELNWLPSTFAGMTGGGSMSNPQMGSAMQEFHKNAEKVQGLPLSQVVSLGMASSGAPVGANASTQPQNPPPQQTSDDNSIPTTKSAAVMKGLGGLFGKKKKQQQDSSQDSSPAPAQSSTSNSQSSTLMEITSEVTSFSSDSLDSGLFAPPSGYTQVPGKADGVLAGTQR